MKFFAVILALSCLFCGWQIGVGVEPLYAQCSTGEMTTTFVVGGIRPSETLSIESMFVTALGDEVYPSVEDMIASIPVSNTAYYYHYSTSEPLYLFYKEPSDWGGIAIIDSRSGDIAFTGTVGWWGGGSIIVPTASNFPWLHTAEAASPPATIVNLLVPEFPYTGDLIAMADRMVDYVLSTDIMISFGECGPYGITTFLYSPNAQWFDGGERGIVIVKGHCGPPWSGAPVGVEDMSWGQVKALYR